MACVSKLLENAPFAPMAACAVTLLMVIETFSPAGGNNDPAAIVPDNVTDGVPYTMLCEAVRLLNTGVALVTVSPCVADAVPADPVSVGPPAKLSL